MLHIVFWQRKVCLSSNLGQFNLFDVKFVFGNEFFWCAKIKERGAPSPSFSCMPKESSANPKESRLADYLYMTVYFTNSIHVLALNYENAKPEVSKLLPYIYNYNT